MNQQSKCGHLIIIKLFKIFIILKLKQFHGSTLFIFEITDSSLKITQQKIWKKNTEHYFFEDVLIKDVYELVHHKKYAYGYVFVFMAFFVHFGIELALNSHTGARPTIISATLTVLSIANVFITETKIYIPTKKQGIIRLYKNKPSNKRVQEFIYILEGKIKIAKKTAPAADKFIYFPE